MEWTQYCILTIQIERTLKYSSQSYCSFARYALQMYEVSLNSFWGFQQTRNCISLGSKGTNSINVQARIMKRVYVTLYRLANV